VVLGGTVLTYKNPPAGQFKTGDIFTSSMDLSILPDKSPANAAIAFFRRRTVSQEVLLHKMAERAG
jgi:hypothetical protein